MGKVMIEMEDGLQDCVDGACESIKEEVLSYLDSNGDEDTDEAPDLNDLDDRGAIHEIIDGSVPVYTKAINDIFYLHGNEIEDAFDNAGIGDKSDKGWPCGWKAAAIYCYIEEKAREWYEGEKDAIFDEWREKNPIPEDEDEDEDDEEEDEEEDKPAK